MEDVVLHGRCEQLSHTLWAAFFSEPGVKVSGGASVRRRCRVL